MDRILTSPPSGSKHWPTSTFLVIGGELANPPPPSGMAVFAEVHQLLIIRLLAPQALWHREPSGLMGRRASARSRSSTALFCILGERTHSVGSQASDTSSLGGERPRHGQDVVSHLRVASPYPYGQFPMYPASKPIIGGSPLALLSHIAHTP